MTASSIPISTFWQTAYRDHGPAVLAYLRSRVRREDAEDLLQETFVRAIRAGDSLRDQTKLRPYLLTIAHNLSINAHRRKRPQLFSEASEEQQVLLEETPDRSASPETRADLGRLEERLDEAMESMTPNLRTAFELAVLRQEPYKVVARQTGWSIAQVKVNVFRARQKAIAQLRELLPDA
ncbi:MAG TPA: sigma-70 family RNA polymerase sigma factor [Thermoanaerobaculia bacterium]|nr:sigma-70 family RNA polymerase sigma factor [Thermoanaerobaculia bacterium]